MTNIKSSTYINEQRREYSLYVLQSRAIPHAADGLKAAARRVVWVAKDGKKRKSATLAGECMPLHPHASPEGAVNTLAAPFGNNIPLLHGYGAFGTLLEPTAYGAARYTSATISDFAKDVVLRDIEIVPMMENYDGTLEEPVHFLPLIPIVLLNPQEGIAVGFASDILPRALQDIVHSQLAYLNYKGFREPKPTFEPIEQKSVEAIDGRWKFVGKIEKVNATQVRVLNLPYGLTHSKFISNLSKLQEVDDPIVLSHVDDSVKQYDILVQFKKGSISQWSEEEILDCLGLITKISENLNVIDFDGKRVWAASYIEIIERFCDWRLTWYKVRYERLADLLAIDMQRYEDILLAIKKNVGGTARQIQSRSDLKDILKDLGIVHIDYIADLQIYRFTEEEKEKVEEKLNAARELMKRYKQLLKSEDERRKVYIEELKEVASKY
jgi:DNA gyrase/topoisomerase IV subunit A